MQDRLWNNKVNRARWVEKQILLWFREKEGKEVNFPEVHQGGFDLVCPDVGNIEVKEDLLATHTGNYAIEFEDHKKDPSGISVVSAKVFVLVDKEAVVIMDTETLKKILKDMKYKKTVPMGFQTLEGTKAKGWLIPRDQILNSPYATVIERWFP